MTGENRVSVSRTINVGNYESVRVEVSIGDTQASVTHLMKRANEELDNAARVAVVSHKKCIAGLRNEAQSPTPSRSIADLLS